MTKRKNHAPEFKAKVALEAIRENMTLAKLSKKYGVHATQIITWKRAEIENMASAFGRRGHNPDTPSKADIEKLHSKIWAARCGTGFFGRCLGSTARNARQKMVSKDHKLSVRRQCALLTLARSNMYYQPKGEAPENLQFMAIIDTQFLETPWYGLRQMARYMQRNNHKRSRHRVQRLIRLIRLVPIYH